MAKHSHHFFLTAIICGLISITAVIGISAQTTTTDYYPSTNYTTTAPTTNTTPTTTYTTPTTNITRTTITCSYQTGDWSSCNSGYRTRTVTATPSGCVESSSKPASRETCTSTVANYPSTATTTNPTTTAVTSCNYNYSSWSTCNSSGYQTRSVTSTYPAGCVRTTDPAISRSCTYISTKTVACSYNYSSWSSCSPSGKQTRTVVSTYPDNCTRSISPLLEQSCTYYNATTTGSETINTTTRAANTNPTSTTTNNQSTATNATGTNTTTTQPFVFYNIIDGTVIEKTFNIEGKVSGASSVEYYIAPAGSNTYKYLGTARNSSTSIWTFEFDSTKNPNGLFYLKARIKNVYGSYESDRVSLTVLNEVPEEVTASSENSTTPDLNATTVSNNQETNRNGLTSNEWQQKYFGSENCRDESVCGGSSDPDKDGLNNNDEFRYGTDPKNSDTDKDGYLDGDEVKNGFNPLKASPGDKSDKIVFESPKESGEVKKDIYSVNNVELVQSEDGNNKLKLSGKALPNSFVTVYIYSDPIILTIKTDEDGNWSYELDKELEDGNHEAYVAVTDNTGKITGKSEPIAFVKSAQAVTVIPPAEVSSGERAQSPTQVWLKRDYLLYIAFGFSALAIIFGVIGLFLHRIRSNTLQS